MLVHKQCYASRCFSGSHGKTLDRCKYGFPFEVPQPCEKLDKEKVRYLYKRTLPEDALVVPYNPEIAILWGASHNVQRVSKHGFEQYLAKYISKPEPSCSIKLPENVSEPERFLRTRVIGAVEALEVLMGFHQNQMSRQVLFLHTELDPKQRMLKPNHQLRDLENDDSDIYLQTKFETYLKRPAALYDLTYPEFYRWWRSATTAEQRKSERNARDLNPRGCDDFQDFMLAKDKLEAALAELSQQLSQCTSVIQDGHDLWALSTTLQRLGVPEIAIHAIEKHYSGVDPLPAGLSTCVPASSYVIADGNSTLY